MRSLAVVLLILLVFASTSSAFLFSRDADLVEKSELMMGTVVQIKVSIGPRDNRAAAEDALSAAFEEIRRVEGVFSIFKPDSEISTLSSHRTCRKNPALPLRRIS